MAEQLSEEEEAIIKKYMKKRKCLIEARADLSLSIQGRCKCLNDVLENYVFKQYLFQDELIEISSLKDLTKLRNYRQSINVMRLDKEMYKYVMDVMSDAWDQPLEMYGSYKWVRWKYALWREYYRNNRALLKGRVKYPLLKNIPSALENNVLDCLTLISKEYTLFYFYSHRLYFCRNNVLYTLEFDYFCIMIYENRLILFVIEADGSQHDTGGFNGANISGIDMTHVRDVLKQYYLSQLSIHLLRIDRTRSVHNQIIRFIDLIVASDDYIIMNKRKPIKINFIDDSEHEGILKFCNNYNVEHRRVRQVLDNPGDNIGEDPSKGFSVKADVLQKVLNRKCYDI